MPCHSEHSEESSIIDMWRLGIAQKILRYAQNDNLI
jgi:hypothetical protein